MFAVAAINFLNHCFAPVTAGKIEIYIRPSFAALVEEPFEHEVIFHGINRRDSQAITDCTVRSAAAALDHNIVFATEIDDVPNNQKVPSETELGYQR